MPPIPRIEVSSRRVNSDSVVPDNNSARLIPRTNLEVRALRNVVEQESQEVLGFLRLVADDAAREARVHIECFLPSHRVPANERMLGQDRFPTDDPTTPARRLCLLEGAVHGAQAFKAFLELGGKTVVCLY